MGACSRESLARGAAGAVERCSCGTLHVSIGPVTVRLPRAGFDELCRTFAAAAIELERRPEIGKNRVERFLEH